MRRLLALVLLLATGDAFAQSSATYRVTLDATWSAQTHPDGFPGNPHFSPLVGAIHNASAKLWEAGGMASGGMEQMAETGGTSILRNEISAIGGDAVLAQVSGGAIGFSPGAVSLEVTATEAHSLLSLVTMLAPSPDWFIGTESLDLRTSNGTWRTRFTLPLNVWDAGTDSGPNYTSGDSDTNPQEPIALINQAPFVVGGTLTPVATITVELLSEVSTEDTPAASTVLRVTPQPILASAAIQIQTEASGDATLSLFDMRGRTVRTLHTGPLTSGAQTLTLDARGLAPGVYVLRLMTEREVTTRRVVIAR